MVNLEALEGEKLFELLHDEWDKRIVGEILAREIIFAIGFGGSLCLNAQKTSNNLIVNSKSGAGKDYVTTEILNLVPGREERWIKRTRISNTVFTYWHNSLKEPDWTWNGKIFYGEDMNGLVLNCDVFKVMCSGGSYSTIVKDQVALNIQINGKPSIIITAAKAVLGEELLRRFAVLNLNESKEQDDMIIDFQSKLATMDKRPEYNSDLMNALSGLKPVNVLIEFADKFSKVFKEMNASVIIRTNYNRFIDLIKYSAVIFQNQRTWLDEKTIFANSEDYDKAVDWFVHLFKNQCLLPITKDQEKLLQIINAIQQATVTDIISEATFASRSWIYLNLNLLTEKGFLEKTRIDDETGYSKKKIDSYIVPNKAKLKIPYWSELE
ncbi:MAG: hypothetical protein WC393_00115 [Candidatus Nanoarchaeia archaeon]|jgi:hypothetical protein